MSGTTSGLTDDILKRLKGEAGASPVFLPDLRIWHAWHSERRTLPLSNPKATFSETCRELGVPAWLPVKVWKSESENAVVATIDSTDERSRSITAGGRTLTSRWSIGPDGDWWQTEYPAKTAEDLKVILNYVEGRRLVADTSELDSLARDVGSEGLVALELPSQPFAWLMLEILGWSEGLMLLMDAMDTVAAIVETATSQILDLAADLASSFGDVVFLSPDNLDAQFISPMFFESYMEEGYRRLADTLRPGGGMLFTHTGGPIASLLGPLAGAGVHGVIGVCGPPQGDADLSVAREQAGDMILWGGIPQDGLAPNIPGAELTEAIETAVRTSRVDPRIIMGIADHVPIDADFDRLRLAIEKTSNR